MNKSFFYPGLLAGGLTLAACTPIMENLPGVYKIDIQQGNIINQEIIDQLRPGMNKRQVLYIMGSPMLVDVFHKERWDYIYSEQKEGDARLQKKASLYFEGDNLVGIQGDFRPGSKPFEKISHETTVELPKREFEKTLWQKISSLFGMDAPDDTQIDIKRPRDGGIQNEDP
ncbi:MAG: outer membrane protein assembly factor BamE, partial [Gammaproteobacteria bacterium HGW-Gammaproteobacteria-10]